MNDFQAILWDCDGCLIDSEWIACGHAASVLTEAGYKISTEEYVRRFAGQISDHIYQTIQTEIGYDIRSKVDEEAKKQERDRTFREKLLPIQGVHELLVQLSLPMAIASGSSFERLALTLKITDLYDQFVPHIYSSSLVENGKPAPDIYLYAAKQLNVSPELCLVIEDSENGVRSGKAAGMTVFGFTGGTHIVDKQAHKRTLSDLGADWVFDDMQELMARLAERVNLKPTKSMQI